MNTAAPYPLDPRLDLAFERSVDIAPQQIWKAWTQPQHLMPWFCPAPWKVVECEIDLRPGGLFRTVMQSPEGQNFPNLGCYLEVIPHERLTWTNALLPGFRPAPPANEAQDTLNFHFTATIALAPHGPGPDTGTRYSAIVRHGDEAACQKHASMGFREGWGIALDQLVAYAGTAAL